MEIKLTDRALEQMGWAKGVHYAYECEDSFDNLFVRVKSETDVMGALSGITITSSRLKLFEFSYPTIRSGLILLVHGETRSGLFNFFDMFDVWLWLLILATTIVMAHLIWIFEREEHSEEYPKGYIKGMKESAWYAFSSLFFANDKPLKTVPARIIAIGFWMMMIVIIASYTANLTLMISADLNRISSVSDIENKMVKV
jgi:hypothetical protein